MICLPSRFACQSSSASANELPGRLDAEVDVARRAAERGGGLSRRDVVDRHRPAERHVEMRVRVDAAREDVLARGVDDPIGVDVERLADHRDPLAVDVDVADVVVGGRDDPPALDQCRHVISPPSAGELRAGRDDRPGAHASSLLAALLQDDDRLLEALAVDVDALLPQVRDRLLREVRAVRRLRRRLLDDLVRLARSSPSSRSRPGS